MQEQVNEKTVALYIKTGKLTAEMLQRAMKKLLSQMKKQADRPPHGKQTLKQLSFYVGMVYLYDVTVNGNFPKICRHVSGRYQFHFFCNQIPFFLCHIELDLYGSFSATHALIAPFRSEGLGHFPTSNFAGQNTEVGTHFLCLL